MNLLCWKGLQVFQNFRSDLMITSHDKHFGCSVSPTTSEIINELHDLMIDERRTYELVKIHLTQLNKTQYGWKSLCLNITTKPN